MGFKKWLVAKIVSRMMKNKMPAHAHLCDFDRLCHEIKVADVLLAQGSNPVSDYIARVTRSSWTHSALYIGRLHDIEDPTLRELVRKNYQGSPREQLLIESLLGQGTIITPIEHYKSDHLRICRPSGLTYNDAQSVIAFAITHLGNKYDVHHFLDLFRFYLRWNIIPRRWKSVIFEKPSVSAKDVCSVMIADAFASIDFPILPLVTEKHLHEYKFIRRNPRLCKPSDFDFSPYFDIIKYPMIPVSVQAAYRHLPWAKEMISDDEHHVRIVEVDEENNNQT